MADVMNEIYTSDETKILSGEFLNFYTPRAQRIRSLKVYFSPKQAGTGTPSPENVRPISGWTGVEVNHCGKNLIGDSSLWEQGQIMNGGNRIDNNKRIRTKGKIRVKPNTIYTVSGSGGIIPAFHQWTSDLSYIADSGWKTQLPYTFTTHQTAEWIELTCRNNNGSQGNAISPEELGSKYTLQLELGSTATEYTPYETKISLDKKYQEIAYLQGDGSQYIDLNFGFDPTDEIETRFSIDTSQITDKYIISPVTWNTDNNRFGMGVHGWIASAYGGKTTSITRLVPNTNNDGKLHDWIYKDKSFSVTDLDISKDVSDITFGSTTANLRLFYGYNANTKGKIASYHHKKADDTEINLIPCYRISDNKPGMYDTVSGQFYTNSGTGEFITGPAVNRYDIDWGDDVGTVYGGYVDLVSGELVETYGKIELTGEENLQKNAWNGNGVYRRTLETAYNPSGIPFMNGSSYGNMLPYYNYGLAPKTDGCFSLAGAGTLPSYTYLLLYNSGWGTTPEEYKAALKTLYDNGTPLTIVAPLKTAYYQTHQLSPTTLSTLARDNNFWSNADRIEIEYDYIGVFNPLESRKNIFSATPHLETVKDSVVSFGTDMAADLKECKVWFKPKQDLHGYSKPWIGGMGKNLLDVSNFKDGYYIDNDGNEQANALFGYTTSYTPVIAGQTYTLSGNVGNSGNAYSAIYYYNENKEFISRETFFSNTLPHTFTAVENAKYVNIQYYAAGNLDTVQLELGSTATVYEPYENICHIEGWDGIEVSKSGKNLYSYNGGSTSGYQSVFLKAGKTYCASSIGGGYLRIKYEDETTSGIMWLNEIKNDEIRYRTFTPSKNVIGALIFRAAGLMEPMIELGSTPTNYEPYESTTLAIQFQQTIYGGYVDLVNGEVVETWTNRLLTSPNNFSVASSGGITYTWCAIKATIQEKLLKTSAYGDSNGMFNIGLWRLNVDSNDLKSNSRAGILSVTATNGTLQIVESQRGFPDCDLTTADGRNQMINQVVERYGGFQIVAKLASNGYYTYPITPQTITTLRGANTIWSNSNDETEVTYYTHNEDAYQHIPTSDAITSSDDFLLVTDDGYVIGTEDDFITY